MPTRSMAAPGRDTRSPTPGASAPVAVDLTQDDRLRSRRARTTRVCQLRGRPRAATRDDVLTGNALENRLDGWDGDDTVVGAGDDDVLFGDDGNDTVNGGDGDNDVNGDDGDDTLIAGANEDDLDRRRTVTTR